MTGFALCGIGTVVSAYVSVSAEMKAGNTGFRPPYSREPLNITNVYSR